MSINNGHACRLRGAMIVELYRAAVLPWLILASYLVDLASPE